MKDRLSTGLSAVVVLFAALACRGKSGDGTPDAAVTTTAATDTATTTASSDTAAPSASAATTATATATAKVKPTSTCHGLMINKRCAKECMGDKDCSDPKERCAPFSGSDDSGQDVQGAVVCQYDKDNEPRVIGAAPSASAVADAGAPKAVTATVGVPAPKGGDCAAGWAPSVSEANKCDKECTTDAQCGAGNKCKAVGPKGSGKQCQKG